MAKTIQIPLGELHFSFSRGSGPGGQNVNKVNSRAVLRWNVGQSPSLDFAQKKRFFERFASRINSEGFFIIASDRFRDQGRNVADCLEKLQALLNAVAETPKLRKKTKPTRAAHAQRLSTKKKHGDKKRGRGKVRDFE